MKKVNQPDITLRWMGTAAYDITRGDTTLLIDPFVSRPSFPRVIAGRPIPPDERAAERRFPRADVILIGHSHFDHLMDAPSIARRTGAVIAGSPTTCFIAEACGVAGKSLLPQADPPEQFRRGGFDVRFIPSLHGKVFLGRVPYPGKLSSVPAPPVKAADYPVGDVYGVWLKAGGLSIYHNGSAGLIDDALSGIGADVLLLGLASRFGTRDYVRRMIELVRPSVIIPCHYDWFFSPLDKGIRHLPGIKLGHFLREVHDTDPGIRVIVPGVGAEVRLCNAGGRCVVM